MVEPGLRWGRNPQGLLGPGVVPQALKFPYGHSRTNTMESGTPRTRTLSLDVNKKNHINNRSTNGVVSQTDIDTVLNILGSYQLFSLGRDSLTTSSNQVVKMSRGESLEIVLWLSSEKVAFETGSEVWFQSVTFVGIGKLFFRLSTLNGSHGEWTESDDLAARVGDKWNMAFKVDDGHFEGANPLFNKLAEPNKSLIAASEVGRGYQAARRIARNRQQHHNNRGDGLGGGKHKKNGGGGQKVPLKPCGPYDLNRFAALSDDDEEDSVELDADEQVKKPYGGEEEEEEVPPIVMVAMEDVDGVELGWDGHQIVLGDGGCLHGFCDGKANYVACMPDTILDDAKGKACGLGFGLSGGKSRWLIKSPFKWVNVNTQHVRATGVSIPNVKGWVFLPLLTRLQDLMGAKVMEHSVSAGQSCAKRYFETVGVPETVCATTVNYWVKTSFESNQKTVLSTLAARIVNECKEMIVSKYDTGVLPHINGLVDNVNFGVHYYRPAEDCRIEPRWQFKNNFSVQCVGGVCNAAGNIYPAFNTLKDPAALARYGQTVMFEFVGQGSLFTTYDVTGNNACLAIKRLIAARDEEEKLEKNQLAILHLLASTQQVGKRGVGTLVHNKLLTKMRHSWRRVKNTVQVPVGPYLMTVDGVGYKESLVEFTIGDSKHNKTLEVETASVLENAMLLNMVNQLTQTVGRSALEYTVDKMKDAAHWTYYTGYLRYLECLPSFVGRQTNAEIAHIKRELRKAYVQGVLVHDDADNMVRRLNACVKKEVAKFGKVPRLFVSYDAGCMYANEMPEYMKVSMDGAYYLPGEDFDMCVHIMAKPKSDSLEKIFASLIEATCRDNFVQVVIYSDDSCYAGMIQGKSFAYNVDISSCDSSNMGLVFGLTGTLLARFNLSRALGLVSQCMKPIHVKNPDDPNGLEEFIFSFFGPFEGSGTVLTTILNHIASALIAGAIADQIRKLMIRLRRDGQEVGKEDIEGCIISGAAHVGHVVTLGICGEFSQPMFEKIQFLKHSPLLSTEGTWVPALNYGCMLRSLGKCDNDLTHLQLGLPNARALNALSWEERMDGFVGGVVTGFVHEPSSCVLEALRNRFPGGSNSKVQPVNWFAEQLSDARDASTLHGLDAEDKGGAKVISDESLCRRYDLEVSDLRQLCHHIDNIALGEVSITKAATRFYAVDYDLV